MSNQENSLEKLGFVCVASYPTSDPGSRSTSMGSVVPVVTLKDSETVLIGGHEVTNLTGFSITIAVKPATT